MSIKGSQTEKNLLKSFAGESQARNRYEAAAKVANKEGYVQIAGIFQETANQEKAHASRFFKFMEGGECEITATYPAGKTGTTAENLKAAAMGENEEWTELYPTFAKVAEDEGFKDVASAFKLIAKVEAEHEARFLKLLKNVETKQVFEKPEKTKWKCWNCGFVHEGTKALEKCPACLHDKKYFAVLEENY